MGALVALFIVASLTRWVLAVRSLRGDAKAEYASRLVDKPATVASVSEAEFVALYVRSFQPHGALYAAGGAAAALLVSPPALILVPLGYDAIWRANGAPSWAGHTGYVYMFSLFFALCFIWAAVAAIFARLAHSKTPEPFHHALARARGEPLPNDPGWRPRPKWARRVRPDPDPKSSPDTKPGA
ncbi:hypothetical protein ACWCOP_00560 [Maricaulaceae bacterium MS644]